MLQNCQVLVVVGVVGTLPRVPIAGVPATSRATWVQEEGGWRVIVVFLWKMYVI